MAGPNVQIKATFKDSLTLETIPDYYLDFKLNENGQFEEIFNGPGKIIYEHFRNRKDLGTKLLFLPTAKLRELSRTVLRSDRIPSTPLRKGLISQCDRHRSDRSAGFSRWVRRFSLAEASAGMWWSRASCGGRAESGDAQQVIGCGDHLPTKVRAFHTPVARLA